MLPIMTTFLNFDDFFPTIFIFSFFQVLASECCDISYNDLDLIFTVDLPTQKHYERVSGVVKSYLYLHSYLYLDLYLLTCRRGESKSNISRLMSMSRTFLSKDVVSAFQCNREWAEMLSRRRGRVVFITPTQLFQMYLYLSYFCICQGGEEE